MKEDGLFARHSMGFYKEECLEQMVNEEEQGRNLEVNAEGQRRFLYDPTEATSDSSTNTWTQKAP
jgi:hypothetical protein